MSPLDGTTLPGLSDALPAGENLENDDSFAALERAARGKPEQQVGDLIVPAEDPDWKDVEAQAASLTARTYDLRVLTLLATARLQRAGIAGFGETLGLIRAVLEQHWDAVHPILDPEDHLDPTLRANALLALTHPGRVLRPLRDMPLASSARAGRISWRDIGIATGALEPPADRERTTETVVRAAFADTDRTTLNTLRAAVGQASLDAAAIGTTFDTRSGYGNGPDLSELIKLLREIERCLERYTPASQESAEPLVELQTGIASQQEMKAPVATAIPGSISTRADAIRLLDLVAEYYQKYEPSSPLPFLLDRARRLADKNFLEILRDMAPEGLGQAHTVIGAREE